MKPGAYVMPPKRCPAMARTVSVEPSGVNYVMTTELTTKAPYWQAGETHRRKIQSYKWSPIRPC